MWVVNGANLRMSENDYGIALPVTVSGTTLGAQDSLRYTFKDAVNMNTILVKEFSNIVQNTVSFELTEAESALFAPGKYVYSLDWYQSGSFMCCLVEAAIFTVGDKA